MNNAITLTAIILALCVGFGAGHYHGKAEVYERVMSKQVAILEALE